MIWQGSDLKTEQPQMLLGTSYGSTDFLNIYGSLLMDTGVTVTYPSYKTPDIHNSGHHDIYLRSTRTNETFKTSGNKFWAELHFESTATWDIPNGILTNSNIYFGTSATTYAAARYNFGGDLINIATPRSGYSTTAYANNIYYYAGNLNMNGHTIHTDYFSSSSGNANRELDISNSTVNINYQFNYSGKLLAAKSANSVINFTSRLFEGTTYAQDVANTMTTAANQVYYDVNFTNLTGALARTITCSGTYNAATTARFNNVTFESARSNMRTGDKATNGTYNKIHFKGNGNLQRVVVDTLQFSNNNSWVYKFQSGDISIASKINKKWYGSGNNCYPITIQSSTVGTQAYVSVAKQAATLNDNLLDVDTLLLDFIKLKDIRAVTTSEAGADGERAILRKGTQSPNSGGFGQDGNNTSWILDNYLGSEGFQGFGTDEILLYPSQYPYTLTSKYFFPTPESTYEWRKVGDPAIIGTADTLSVTNEGEYILTIHYCADIICELSDTVRLTTLTDPYRWYYLSSPYINAQVRFLRPVGNHDGEALIGYYNEAKHAWEPPIIGNDPTLGGNNYSFAPNDTNAVFFVGRGFAASVDSMAVKFRPPTANSFIDVIDHTALTPNSGKIPRTITNTVADASNPNPKRGNNLVGNPYLDYLDFDALATANPDISTTYHIRGMDERVGSRQMKYDSYNAATGVGTAVIRLDALSPYIPPVQGFWVFLPDENPLVTRTSTLTFTNTMRRISPPVQPPLYAPQANGKKVVRLNIYKGNIHEDQTVFAFNPAASNAYDMYDSRKMTNGDNSIPELYTMLANEEISINGRQQVIANQAIPLGFRTGEEGMFGIGATTENLDDMEVILVDNLLGTETDITGKRYDFASTVANGTNRFSIVFRPDNATAISNNTVNNNLLVYVNENNQVVVVLTDAARENNYSPLSQSVLIFNAVGQKLAEESITSTPQTLKYRFESGVYIIKIGNETNRVIIK
jgi:hypothetical protein